MAENEHESKIEDPVELGYVTSPSGMLVVVDCGLLNLWAHSAAPSLPEGTLDDPEAEIEANNAQDLFLEGPDARAAGLAYDRGCHPLFIYDVPRKAVANLVQHFSDFAKDNSYEAVLTPLSERISHRERIALHLASGEPKNGISFHGISAAVVSGIPPTKRLRVLGRRRSVGSEFESRWHDVYLELQTDAKVVRSELRGYAAVDKARLIFADADGLGDWIHEDPIDGRADFVFWGADAELAATQANAPKLDEQNFGWQDLEVRKVIELGTKVEALRSEKGWRFATDFRPHSHHWQAMEEIRLRETESATVVVGCSEMCVFMTSWGDGLFEVYADYDAQDRLARVRIALGTDRTLKRVQAVEERYFGDFAKMAFVSKKVVEDGGCVRFLYREEPDREQDSGWRAFAGGETDDYANDASNVLPMPLRDLLERDASIEETLRAPVGSMFERESCDALFTLVTDWELDS